MIDIRDQNQITKLTKQITKLEKRIKALESALQVSPAGVALTSTQAITIQSGTVMTLKGTMIHLNQGTGIMGQPAARITDMHTCPMVTGLVPHVGGPILSPGAPTVLIGNVPAASVGDMAKCVGPPDTIIKGSATVMICNKPAARLGDSTAHGGTIVVGCATVLIGG